MQDQMRRAGIDNVGDVPWGTHFCQFYQTKEDLFDVLVPYFKAGLETNEFCMWVTAEPLNVEDVIQSMTREMPDFANYLASGQIEILPCEKLYLEGGYFDSQRILNDWVEKLGQALTRGFGGLRLTGNAFRSKKKERASFTEYEAAINNVIGKHQILSLCTYSLDLYNAREIMDIIGNHKFALVKQEGKWERIEKTGYLAANKAPADSEERYKLAVEIADEGIIIAGPDGKIQFANQKMADMLGYTRGELIGKNGLDFLVEGQKSLVLRTRKRLQKGSRIQCEFKFKRKSGPILWTISSACPLKDKQGCFAGNIAVHTDITRLKKEETRKQNLLEKVQEIAGELESSKEELRITSEELEAAKEELRQQTDELNHLVSFPELNPNPVMELDAQGKLTYMNSAAKRHLPELPELGANHTFLAEINSIVEKFRNENWPSISRDVVAGDRWYEQTLIPVEAGSNFRIYARDITTRKQAEANLLRLNRELKAISDCNQAIVRAIDEQHLSADVCKIMCDVVGYRMAWLGAVENDKAKSVRPVAWYGDDNGYLAKASVTWADTERGRGPTGVAARTGKTDLCQDFTTEPKALPWQEEALKRGFRSSIAIPLVDTRNNVFAVFTLYSGEPKGFTPAEVKLLEELAGDLAFGINAIRMKQERTRAEEALKQSEQLYHSLFDNMIDGYAHCRMIYKDGQPQDFVYLAVNGAFERLTGLKDVVGRKVSAVIPGIKQSNPELFEIYGRVASTGQPERFETSLASLGIFLSISVYSPDKGTFTAVFENITERKKAEDEVQKLLGSIQQEKEKLSTLVSSIPDEVWFADTQKNFTLANVSALHEFGFNLADGINVEDMAKNLEVYRPDGTPRPVEEAPPLLALKGETIKDQEEIVRTPASGKLRYRQISAAPVKDASGNTIGSVSVVRDITERKQMEEALKKSESQLAEAQRVAHIGSWEWNIKTGEIHWSAELYSIYGVDPHTFTPTVDSFAEYVHPDDRGLVNRMTNQLVSEGKSFNFDFRIVLTAGSPRIINTMGEITEFDENGKPRLIVGINQDITERKQTEEALQRYARELEMANKELESFSYSVSHDLKAPLRGIDGFSSALLEDCADRLDETGKDYLYRIRKSSQRMSHLIDDMLKLSRISLAEMHPDKVNLSDIVQRIAEEMGQTQPGRKMEFIIAPEIVAYGDKFLLDSLLRNVLENACKFTSKSSQARIEFGLIYRDEIPVYFIKDNGVGFDMQYADKLFKPFSRLHNQSDYPGTGIGLANVQRVVRRHGGRVWAEGEIGRGATFYFTLGKAYNTCP